MKNKILSLLLFSFLIFFLPSCITNTERNSTSRMPIEKTEKQPSIENKEEKNQTLTAQQLKDQEFIQKLVTLQTKQPSEDAQQFIATGDKRFIAKAGRGINIPGIDDKTYQSIKHQCSLRYVDGFGDLLYGKNHRRYYDAIVDYAKAYNAVILKTCLK